jgi:hypothetical protein
MPRQAFEFGFSAVPEHRLIFTEMFGQSNDLFFAPDENGIAQFGGNDNPISETFTGAVQLWDAGSHAQHVGDFPSMFPVLCNGAQLNALTPLLKQTLLALVMCSGTLSSQPR